MYYADIKKRNVANGPGVRVNLFVSGCENYCKGCFNKEAWDFEYGTPYTRDTTLELIKLLEPDYIKGLTILGGEPLCHQNIKTVKTICREIKNVLPNKNIWVYTGYTLEKLTALYTLESNPERLDNLCELISLIDVLVDGPFVEELKDVSLKFRGSSNQRVIDINDSEFIKGNNALHISNLVLVDL